MSNLLNKLRKHAASINPIDNTKSEWYNDEMADAFMSRIQSKPRVVIPRVTPICVICGEKGTKVYSGRHNGPVHETCAMNNLYDLEDFT